MNIISISSQILGMGEGCELAGRGNEILKIQSSSYPSRGLCIDDHHLLFLVLPPSRLAEEEPEISL